MPRTTTLKSEQAGRFETDFRCVHQEHRVHPKYDGFLRGPDRIQLIGHPTRRLEQDARVKTRDSIDVAISEVKGCNYCLTVHSFMAKLPAHEINLARNRHTTGPKRDGAVQFARKVTKTRGNVGDTDLKAVRDASYTDANVMEIVVSVAMYSLTNFFNNVFDPEKDFPVVTPTGSI